MSSGVCSSKSRLLLELLALLAGMTVLSGQEGPTIQDPERYVAPSLSGASATCPTPDTLSSLRRNISEGLGALLRDRVVPAFNCPLGQCEDHPAKSCNQIYQGNSSSVSGTYWLRRCDGAIIQVYCSMGTSPCSCESSPGGWKRIAFLNTTDINQPCPGGTVLFTQSNPIRTCARRTHGCISLVYSSDFMEYRKVCGRVIGYQHRSPDAFSPYNQDRSKTIDDNYVDGVSITYGHSPRKHIWTMAVGLDETRVDVNRCPCANSQFTYTDTIPPFIGSDYFCATGSRQAVGAGFYPDDPVWDGLGCGPLSTCCTFNSPPWFCKTLGEATRENMEFRLCGDEDTNNENIPISLVELYVQ